MCCLIQPAAAIPGTVPNPLRQRSLTAQSRLESVTANIVVSMCGKGVAMLHKGPMVLRKSLERRFGAFCPHRPMM